MNKQEALDEMKKVVRDMVIAVDHGEPEEQVKAKNTIEVNSLEELKIPELAEYQVKLRQIVDGLDRAKKEMQGVYDVCVTMLASKMLEDGITNVTVDGVGRVTVTSDVYASIKVENRQAAYQFLRDTGNGDLIKDTVNASSLKSLVKSMLKDGVEIPEGTITYSPYSKTSITKVK